jgi:integrase
LKSNGLFRDGSGWQFSQPKTVRSRRTIPLPVSLVTELKQHQIRQHKERLKLGADWQDFDLVFPSQVGTALTMGRITRVFQRIKNDAEIKKPIRLYDLRHSTATFLLQANVNPKAVSERLGHSTITLTLDVYSHVLPTMQEQATEHLEDLIFSKTRS